MKESQIRQTFKTQTKGEVAATDEQDKGPNVWIRQSVDEPTIFTTLNNTVANNVSRKKGKRFGRDFIISHNIVKKGKESPLKVPLDDKPLPVLVSDIEMNPST